MPTFSCLSSWQILTQRVNGRLVVTRHAAAAKNVVKEFAHFDEILLGLKENLVARLVQRALVAGLFSDCRWGFTKVIFDDVRSLYSGVAGG